VIQIDTLHPDHKLRNTPLIDIGAAYQYRPMRTFKPIPVKKTMPIARSTLNELRPGWFDDYTWWAKV
jgi:hypothetical protein